MRTVRTRHEREYCEKEETSRNKGTEKDIPDHRSTTLVPVEDIGHWEGAASDVTKKTTGRRKEGN